jgi:hypothetical protein
MTQIETSVNVIKLRILCKQRNKRPLTCRVVRVYSMHDQRNNDVCNMTNDDDVSNDELITMKKIVDDVVYECCCKNMSTNETIDACYNANNFVRRFVKCHNVHDSNLNDAFDDIIDETLTKYRMHDNYN